jgi:GR25 family glycosyltransferase involved in LPS biosynthesis
MKIKKNVGVYGGNLIFMVVVVIIIVFIIITFFIFNVKYQESLENQTEINLTYNVIHIKGHSDRYKNIKENEKKLGEPIIIFDAVKGDSLNQQNLNASLKKYDSNLTIGEFKPKHINEIGCFLSHFLLIRSIMNDSPHHGYSVILEDDFSFSQETGVHLHIKNILSKLETNDPDFGMIVLGTFNNDPAGENIIDDIYRFNTDPNIIVYGIHGYIINNKKAQTIYENLLTIKTVVDVQLFDLIRSGIIHGYIIKPMVVNQNGSPTTILLN